MRHVAYDQISEWRANPDGYRLPNGARPPPLESSKIKTKQFEQIEKVERKTRDKGQQKTIPFAMNIPTRSVIITLGIFIAFVSVTYWLLKPRSPLEKYGVFFEKTSGESDSLQDLQFYLKREGARIQGPLIHGDQLYITYQYRNEEEVPDAVVRSNVYIHDFVTVRLNLSDKSKPEFRIPTHEGLTINYPPLGYHWP
jgi:hypothetical protein